MPSGLREGDEFIPRWVRETRTAPCIAAASKIWVCTETERIHKDVAEWCVCTGLQQLAQAAWAAGYKLRPQAVQTM